MPYLRNTATSYNDFGPNFEFGLSAGYMDITLPDDFDNTSSDPLVFTFDIGAIAVTVPPDIIHQVVQLNPKTIDNGSFQAATISGDGISIVAGTVFSSWGTVSTPDVSVFQRNNIVTAEYAGNILSGTTTLLADGAAQGFPGDASFTAVAGAPGGITSPVGWGNFLGDATLSLVHWSAGETVTFEVSLSGYSDDAAHPDLYFYSILSSIKYTYRGTDYPVPLTSLRTGWANGSTTGVTPYPSAYFEGQGAPYFFNPLRDVEFAEPPVSSLYQDLYLEGATPQRTQGHIF